jgi:hypothetical protein
MQIIAGKTDVSISIYARALSGAPLTGKVAADFALTYRRAGANVPLSLSNLASVDAAHTDGGLYEVGNGEYRLDLPDAACATGDNQVSVTGTVDGGVLLGYPIQLDAERTPGGSYTQTVTVKTSAAVAIQGATVQILDGAGTVIDSQTTNSSGVATPTCNAGDFSLVVSYPGIYRSSTKSMTVAAAGTHSVTLTAIGTIPAPTASGTVTGYGYCRAGATAQSGILVYVQQVSPGTRVLYDSDIVTLTSDVDGLVSTPLLTDGSRYKVKRESGSWSDDFLPSEDVVGGGTFLLPGLLGG